MQYCRQLPLFFFLEEYMKMIKTLMENLANLCEFTIKVHLLLPKLCSVQPTSCNNWISVGFCGTKQRTKYSLFLVLDHVALSMFSTCGIVECKSWNGFPSYVHTCMQLKPFVLAVIFHIKANSCLDLWAMLTASTACTFKYWSIIDSRGNIRNTICLH